MRNYIFFFNYLSIIFLSYSILNKYVENIVILIVGLLLIFYDYKFISAYDDGGKKYYFSYDNFFFLLAKKNLCASTRKKC